MPRKPIDYKKLYQESDELFKDQQVNVELAIKKIGELENRHKNLNLEFDKAVEINKKFQNTIIEQRGVINYLEGKIDAKKTN